MPSESVLAEGLMPSGRGRLMFIRKGALQARFHGELFERSGETLRDKTAVFRRVTETTEEITHD